MNLAHKAQGSMNREKRYWLTVKHATTIAIPGRALKLWICRIADEKDRDRYAGCRDCRPTEPRPQTEADQGAQRK